MKMNHRWHRYAFGLLVSGVAMATSAQATSVSRIERQLEASAQAQKPASVRPVASATGAGAKGGGNDVSLALTITPYTGDPEACGSTTEVEVRIGDQVNICYTITNNGASTLTHHSLTDSLDGDLLAWEPITVASGQSHAFVRTIVATADTTRTAELTSYSTLPQYTADDEATPNFIDIAATGTDVGFDPGNGLNNEFTAVQAGFPLRLYGVETTDLCVTNDGFVGFDDAECVSPAPGSKPQPGYSFNQDMPTPVYNGITVPAYLAPFWTDLDDGPGRVYTQTLGTAPNRQFVIQWEGLYHYMISSTAATFQIVFDEASDTIRYEYRGTVFGNEADNGNRATVGLQGDPRGLYTKYSYNQPTLEPNSAIVWTYTPSVDTSATGNAVSISAGDPVLAVAQPGVAALAVTGTEAHATLTVRNEGNRDLTWSLAEAPGASARHLPAVPRHVSRASTALPQTDNVAHRAPVARGADAPSIDSLVRGAFNVPTYAVSFMRPGLVTFDALDPVGTFTPVNASTDWIYAAAFLDNDFSRLWVIVQDSWDYIPGTYGTVDVATGVFTVLGEITGGPSRNWAGLTQDPLTGMVYAANFSNNPFSAEGALFTLDMQTGEARRIGAIEGPGVHPVRFIPGLAVSPDGRMYGLDLYGQSLIAIDKTTGAASVVESLGLDVRYQQDIEFDQATGDLYWAALYGTGGQTLVSEMRVIDPLTALSQPIAPLPPGGDQTFDEFTALAIAHPSVGCAAPADVPWLSFAGETSGLLVPGASQDVDVVLDATGLAAGMYEATICVFGDDPRRRAVPVNVTLAVTDAAPVVDQAAVDLSLGLFNNEVVAPKGTSVLSAESADDFVVDGHGWTVSAFSFAATANGSNPLPTSLNVSVVPDDGNGAPSTQAACSVDAQAAVSLVDEHHLVVFLPEPCELEPGTYWVVWSFADINIASSQYGFAVAVPEQHGAAGVWRNPAGALGFGCTSWSPFASCGTLVAPSARDLAFAVYATPAAAPPCDAIMSDDFEDAPTPTACRP